MTVYRTAARANPVSTLIARIFGISPVDVGATATATAAPADSETCVLPFTIPDKWIEKRAEIPVPLVACRHVRHLRGTRETDQNAGGPLPIRTSIFPRVIPMRPATTPKPTGGCDWC